MCIFFVGSNVRYFCRLAKKTQNSVLAYISYVYYQTLEFANLSPFPHTKLQNSVHTAHCVCTYMHYKTSLFKHRQAPSLYVQIIIGGRTCLELKIFHYQPTSKCTNKTFSVNSLSPVPPRRGDEG